MRRGREPKWILTDDGQLMGIDLSADYVSEHEWGIADLHRAFGVRKRVTSRWGLDDVQIDTTVPLGLEGRRIATLPLDLYLFKYGKRLVLLYNSMMGRAIVAEPKKYFPGTELHTWEKDGRTPIAAAWSGNDFAISVVEKNDKEKLRELHAAFERKDIAFWVGGSGVFQNGGLIMVIASRVPADKRALLDRADAEVEQREKAVQITGIREKLRQAGKEAFALSPRLEEDGTLVFWLNPADQKNDNYGWFRLSDLEDWIEGRGRIPKQAHQQK